MESSDLRRRRRGEPAGRRSLGLALAAAAAGGALAGVPAGGACGQEPVERSGLVMRAAEAERAERSAIEHGLEFLAARAQPSGAVGERYPVAVTGLTGLAFLGAGHRLSNSGPYSGVLDGCLRYILASERRGGFITESLVTGESRMHGHGFALLFLAQAFGELPAGRQEPVAGVIRRAIDCAVRAQSSRGGWTYLHENPEDDDEASVTIGVLQALRAARDVGFHVPIECIDRARSYVEACQVPDGGFKYSIRRGENRTSFALTAAAVSTLHAIGEYDSPALRHGFDYMGRLLSGAGGRPRRAIADPFFFYGALYATQAYFQRGGPEWERWRAEATRYILDGQQKSNGRWKDDDHGDEFATAAAVLILEVPIQYLPIFQR
jgi:hypothetical protein